MKKALFAVLFSFPAFGLIIDSECDTELRVATASVVYGGADGLGNSGGWGKRVSTGWFRIGPYKQIEVSAGYIRVERTPRKPVSRVIRKVTDNKGTVPELETFCVSYDPNNGFDLTVWEFDNTVQRRAKTSLPHQCFQQNGHWKVFEKAPFKSNYTIRGEQCTQEVNPGLVQMMYRRQPDISNMLYVRLNPFSKDWYGFDAKNLKGGGYPNYQIQETDFIVLDDKSGNLYGLKKGEFRVKYAGTNNWQTVGTGAWVE